MSLTIYTPILEKSPLFRSIPNDQLESFLESAQLITRKIPKNGFVAIAGEPMEGIGILLSGHAHLTRENMLGQRTIVTELKESDIFGEALLFTDEPLWPATIQATKESLVIFIPSKTFTHAFPNCQSCQLQMLTNLLHDMSEKAMSLTRKVHYLMLKGMREKIFAYFMDIYRKQKTSPIILPHNRQEMADVLNVSRTALSRELSRLQDEGIIDFKGRMVHILKSEVLEDYGF